IEAKIRQAKLEANPLFIGLDDAPDKQPDAADDLRARMRKAEAERSDSGELVGPDGKLQMMIVRTAFASGDVENDRQLQTSMEQLMTQVRAEVPGAEMGVAGDVVVSVAEHDSILNGMVLATLVTVSLVLIGLTWFFGSALAVGALSWSLAVGTLATFAFT